MKRKIDLIYCGVGNEKLDSLAIQIGLLYGARLPIKRKLPFKIHFADQDWKNPDLEAYKLVPFWRIVVASIVAEAISELVDGEMCEKWQVKFGRKRISGRVLFSNLFSIPIDSFVFSFIAFYGDLPIGVVWSIFASNVIIKFIIGTVSFPLIYYGKQKD